LNLLLEDTLKHIDILSDFSSHIVLVDFEQYKEAKDHMGQQFVTVAQLTSFNEDLKEFFVHEIVETTFGVLHKLNNMRQHLTHFLNQLEILAFNRVVHRYQLLEVQFFNNILSDVLFEHEQVVDQSDHKDEQLLFFGEGHEGRENQVTHIRLEYVVVDSLLLCEVGEVGEKFKRSGDDANIVRID
jgi:hypothetical protein